MKIENSEIEAIAKVLNDCCNHYDEFGRHLGNKCAHCEYWCDTNNICCSYNEKEAEALYNAGYRKIPEGSVVLTREEYEQDLMDLYDAGYEFGQNETAKEIFYKLKETLIINNEENTEFFDYDYTLETIDKLATRYGVEMEE